MYATARLVSSYTLTGGPQVPIPNLEKLIDKVWWIKHVKHQICVGKHGFYTRIYPCMYITCYIYTKGKHEHVSVICMHVSMSVTNMCVCIYIYIHRHTYIHIDVHRDTYLYVYVCVYMHI